MSEPYEFDDPWNADGGPAFPNNVGNIAYKGMTMRDWFAGQALYAARYCDSATEMAERAYEIADAMLAARKEKP